MQLYKTEDQYSWEYFARERKMCITYREYELDVTAQDIESVYGPSSFVCIIASGPGVLETEEFTMAQWIEGNMCQDVANRLFSELFDYEVYEYMKMIKNITTENFDILSITHMLDNANNARKALQAKLKQQNAAIKFLNLCLEKLSKQTSSAR